MQLHQIAVHRLYELRKEYEKAGIALVAVSTDRLEDLSKSLAAVKSEGGFPIPLASDAGLEVFKKYQAYDDFEKIPLHATFLVDGGGMIRWQDIAAEPFNDPAFLLAESKRLLAQGEGERAAAR